MENERGDHVGEEGKEEEDPSKLFKSMSKKRAKLEMGKMVEKIKEQKKQVNDMEA